MIGHRDSLRDAVIAKKVETVGIRGDVCNTSRREWRTVTNLKVSIMSKSFAHIDAENRQGALIIACEPSTSFSGPYQVCRLSSTSESTLVRSVFLVVFKKAIGRCEEHCTRGVFVLRIRYHVGIECCRNGVRTFVRLIGLRRRR
ncbi:unnamed protein product [Albugo candida]|uniref:Uncharacterized protein n=1 Tax=Albugo candida TaxID=65357 RepID=A0A024GJS3_9STRA|nr:unnamed protein product [Albugo candida]|eukprot:CCI46579.1 unnamed protein product [Albugo candida]